MWVEMCSGEVGVEMGMLAIEGLVWGAEICGRGCEHGSQVKTCAFWDGAVFQLCAG